MQKSYLGGLCDAVASRWQKQNARLRDVFIAVAMVNSRRSAAKLRSSITLQQSLLVH